MPHDYDNSYREEFRRNVDDAPRAMREGELDEKIGNFCDLHGFDRNRVAKEILSNRIVAALFAKNPNKQKFHEKEATRFIRSLEGVENFRDLHNSKLYLVAGAVLTKDVIKSGAYPNAKTIDFSWEYGENQFYASISTPRRAVVHREARTRIYNSLLENLIHQCFKILTLLRLQMASFIKNWMARQKQHEFKD